MFRTVPLSIVRSFSLYTQRNCPKHVEFYSKNKFQKLVHLVGFITRIFSCYRTKHEVHPNCEDVQINCV